MTTFKESVKQTFYSILFFFGFAGLFYFLLIVNYFYLGISLLTLLVILALIHGQVIDYFLPLILRIPKKNKDGENNLWHTLVYFSFFYYNKFFLKLFNVLFKIYPFSALHERSLERWVREWIQNYSRELAEFTRKKNVPLIVTTIDSDSQFFILNLKQEGKIPQETYFKRLEKLLEEKYTGCYLRSDENGFRLLVPVQNLYGL